VPGQTAHNETRRVVLKGADGIVFVADSQWTLLPKNLESWQSLGENLAANGLALDTMPVVVQYNKRDLPDILSIEAMEEALGFSAYPHVEAVASQGRGVTETFKLISKLTFLDLLRRLQGRPTPDAVAVPTDQPAPPPAGETGEDSRPPLTLVRTPPDEGVDETPFPEAAAPFDVAPAAVAAEIEERLRTLEGRFASLEAPVEAVERLRARLEAVEKKIDEAHDGFAAETASSEQRTEERIRALAERFDEQASAFARDIQEMQRALSEKAEPHREELKLQLAPLLEEQVRRETDENWTAEIERLRQALAESLDDLSERVRKAVRG
jgi:hypothetical protein